MRFGVPGRRLAVAPAATASAAAAPPRRSLLLLLLLLLRSRSRSLRRCGAATRTPRADGKEETTTTRMTRKTMRTIRAEKKKTSRRTQVIQVLVLGRLRAGQPQGGAPAPCPPCTPAPPGSTLLAPRMRGGGAEALRRRCCRSRPSRRLRRTRPFGRRHGRLRCRRRRRDGSAPGDRPGRLGLSKQQGGASKARREKRCD